MLVTMVRTEWTVFDEEQLRSVLQTRDVRGGAEFWLTHAATCAAELPAYPALNIRLYNESACATYFPDEGHPGFRCCGGFNLDPNGMTTFVFDGCDPWTGEDAPNEFVIDNETAFAVATEYMQNPSLPQSFRWFEL